jgi:hypothetical protein
MSGDDDSLAGVRAPTQASGLAYVDPDPKIENFPMYVAEVRSVPDSSPSYGIGRTRETTSTRAVAIGNPGQDTRVGHVAEDDVLIGPDRASIARGNITSAAAGRVPSGT